MRSSIDLDSLFLRRSGASALLLACLLATVPLRAAAQQQAPAPSAQPAAQSDYVSTKEMEKEEERGENAYRHSSVIKAASRVLHLSTEATARSFEIINIAVVVLGLGIPLYRFLPRYLRERSDKVSRDIEAARKQTQDAGSRLSAVEAKLAHLGDEIARFRAQIEEEMRADEARIKESIEEESARIVASAEQEIGLAAAQARRSLRSFAADLAIESAARQMTLTPEQDRALIAEFVGDAGKGRAN